MHQKYEEQLRILFKQAQNLVFDDKSASFAAEIKQNLTQKGEFIGDRDTMIAAIGLRHNAIVVTYNVKHFQRVNNLIVVN